MISAADVPISLGGMTPATFLERHWQKKPLLVRQALPRFAGLLGRAPARELFAIARAPGAVGRVVREQRGRYRVDDAATVDERKLNGRFSVLVQGAEGFVDGGWELLSRFSFVPQARIDDLMISYASEGGGVGPHEDRYDVFLLQGPGRRRWQIQEGGARVFDETQPTKILTSFAPTDEWILDPGDMLYLPPGVAHCGTAVDGDCCTYSIGFLAPSHEALVQNWLAFLAQSLEEKPPPLLQGIYADPALAVATDPLEVPDAMIGYVRDLVTRASALGDVEEFVGRLLTGPKPNVVFDAPARPLSHAAFAARLAKDDGVLALSRKSRGLKRGARLFLNGEMLRSSSSAAPPPLLELLRARRVALPLRGLDKRAIEWLYGAYAAGGVLLSRR